ncbi:MAG: hypothetical protein ACK6D7_02050, partial [Acidobacteriota bacterium]
MKATVSQGQLRGIVRARGEEAGGELQHRMQMNPRKAFGANEKLTRCARKELTPLETALAMADT